MDNITPAPAINTFDVVSAQQSTKIYRQFVLGKVITKQVYDEINVTLVENPLFTLLFNQQPHFENLYKHLGYELCFVQQGDFYYVRESREDSSEEAERHSAGPKHTFYDKSGGGYSSLRAKPGGRGRGFAAGAGSRQGWGAHQDEKISPLAGERDHSWASAFNTGIG